MAGWVATFFVLKATLPLLLLLSIVYSILWVWHGAAGTLMARTLMALAQRRLCWSVLLGQYSVNGEPLAPTTQHPTD